MGTCRFAHWGSIGLAQCPTRGELGGFQIAFGATSYRRDCASTDHSQWRRVAGIGCNSRLRSSHRSDRRNSDRVTRATEIKGAMADGGSLMGNWPRLTWVSHWCSFLRISISTTVAARPPDVRKGFAFPTRLSFQMRLCRLVRWPEAQPPQFQKNGLTERQSLSSHQRAQPQTLVFRSPKRCCGVGLDQKERASQART